MAGPRIHVTGPYLEGKGSFTPQMRQLTDAEDARRTVEYWIAEGATSFKAYMNITPDELAAAVQSRAWSWAQGHRPSLLHRFPRGRCSRHRRSGTRPIRRQRIFPPARNPVSAPTIPSAAEKSLLDLDIAARPVQDMIRDLVAHHVAITSTLPVFETFVPNRAPLDARVLDAMLPDTRIEYLERRSSISDHAAASYWPALFKKELEFEREFVKRGGLLLAGLDPTGYGGVIAGFGDQREVELLVEAGFTPLEAIHIATSNGGRIPRRARQNRHAGSRQSSRHRGAARRPLGQYQRHRKG